MDQRINCNIVLVMIKVAKAYNHLIHRSIINKFLLIYVYRFNNNKLYS